jgi:hypothetical protein
VGIRGKLGTVGSGPVVHQFRSRYRLHHLEPRSRISLINFPVTPVTGSRGNGAEDSADGNFRNPRLLWPRAKTRDWDMYRRIRALFQLNLAMRAALLLCVVLCGAKVASARDEVLRWTHPDTASIQAFEALVGTQQGNYVQVFDLGLPQADGQGVMSNSIEVGDNENVYIAIRAIGLTGLASPASNERLRAAPSGGTTPPPGEAGATLPPTDPAAITHIDFATAPISDWLDTQAGNSMIEDSSLFSIASFSGESSLSTQSEATNIHSHFVGSPNIWSNVVIRGRMAASSANSGIGVTAYSQYPSSDTYYRLRSSGASTFEISSHPDGGFACAGADTGVSPKAGVWYEFEWSIENLSAGNRIEARVWLQGDARPSSAQAECLDTTAGRPLAGAIGVWSMGTGQKYWDDFEIVTLSGAGAVGEPPAPPILIDVVPAQ